jgi:hypothetical protein
MARLRPFLTELFQRAVGVWRRQRSFADSRFNLSVFTQPRSAPNREAWLRLLGYTMATLEAEASCPARRTRAASTMYNATRYP